MTIRQFFLLSILIVVTSAGCADTAFIQSAGRLFPGTGERARRQRAVRILCLWEAAEGQGLDGRSARGFAGQILFFGSLDAAPIPVHGTVRIYEYENFHPDDIAAKPIHIFVFDDSGWNAHRAESTVGQSYNVFLPYVKRHNGMAMCALKVEFLSGDGRLISSPITEITLDPRQSRSRKQSALTRNVISKEPAPLSGQSGSAGNTPHADDKQLESLTIRLSQSFK